MDKINITTIIVRLRAKTPVFWKRIRRLMILCGTIGGALIAMPQEQTASLLSHFPVGFPGTLLTIGAVGTALASITKEDSGSEKP